MKGKSKYVIFILLFSHFALFAQSKGTVLSLTIYAPSLANSIIGEPVNQPILVYLPPTYNLELTKQYPVIYYLPGYSGKISDFTDANSTWYSLESSMNYSISQAKIKEVIFVIINGYNLLEGSFYSNSPVTGNWEDFVVKDVVKYMD